MTNIDERRIATVQRDGREAMVAVIRRSYPAAPEDVWPALTDPKRIPNWFMPISGDLTVGGRYQLEGNAGGVVEACEPPERFAVTWEYGSEVSWLVVRLDPAGSGTVVELEHTAFVSADRWDEYGPGATGVGWDLGLLGLGWHLGSGSSTTAEEGAAWAAGPEGIAYIRASSAAWIEASVAAGTDPAAAAAAGARTTAFYTGQPA